MFFYTGLLKTPLAKLACGSNVCFLAKTLYIALMCYFKLGYAAVCCMYFTLFGLLLDLFYAVTIFKDNLAR